MTLRQQGCPIAGHTARQNWTSPELSVGCQWPRCQRNRRAFQWQRPYACCGLDPDCRAGRPMGAHRCIVRRSSGRNPCRRRAGFRAGQWLADSPRGPVPVSWSS
jgi:hypothetical protein